MYMIWKRTSGKFEQILFNKFITTIRLFGITSMIVEFLYGFPHGRFLRGYEIRQCQWAAAAPLGPNEHTTAAAVYAGITSSQHSHMRASNFSNQWEDRYEVNALKIIYDRFLLPNAKDIIETVRLLGRLSMVRSNLKKKILFNKLITTVRLFGITSMVVEFLFWIPTWTFSWRLWDSTVSMSSSSTTGTKWSYNNSSRSCRDPLVTTLPHASIQIGF